MIRSAIAGNIELDELDLVQRQLIFAVVGFVVILVITAIDYRLWASISRTLYGYGRCVAVLYVVGAALFGSARWFDTGVILIQPSELAKIVMILVLADFFTRNQDNLGDLGWIGRSFLLTMGIVFWILLQPNLSTSIVMIVLWFALLWASGLRLKHLLFFLAWESLCRSLLSLFWSITSSAVSSISYSPTPKPVTARFIISSRH